MNFSELTKLITQNPYVLVIILLLVGLFVWFTIVFKDFYSELNKKYHKIGFFLALVVLAVVLYITKK